MTRRHDDDTTTTACHPYDYFIQDYDGHQRRRLAASYGTKQNLRDALQRFTLG